MFVIAILIGVYSYIIFSLGILGILYKTNILIVTAIFVLMSFGLALKIFNWQNIKVRKININFKNQLSIILITVFVAQFLANLIGALGPELSFDALWYHLTLPKIYLINHAITYIPGGLLYYSVMPKLTEMLYAVALAFQGETLAKIMHLTFGILGSIALFKLSKVFMSTVLSLVTVVVFYSNLVVAWESTTAYVDLARAFYEVMVLWGFVKWLEKKEKKWLIISAVMTGLAISVKLLAIGSLFIFTILIIYSFTKENKKNLKNIITNILVYWYISIFVAIPWFIFSFLNTGNPIYPFFSQIYKTEIALSLINPVRFLNDIWIAFTRAQDPISPLYILFFPILVLLFRKINKKLYPVVIYSALSLIIWYITPRTGGGRFILPYLPAFSMLVSAVLMVVGHRTRKFLTVLILLTAISSIFYRGFANSKYLSVIIGKETKDKFLINNLNYKFGDFYDTDNYFRKNITSSDTVLLYGFHNLYYVNFPFIDSSWIKKGDRFNYIAVQNGDVPEKFKKARLVYENQMTGVKLFSKGQKEWVY